MSILRVIVNPLLAIFMFLVSGKESFSDNRWEAETWEAGGYLFLSLLVEIGAILFFGVSMWWFIIPILTFLVAGFWCTMLADCEFVDQQTQPSWMHARP